MPNPISKRFFDKYHGGAHSSLDLLFPTDRGGHTDRAIAAITEAGNKLDDLIPSRFLEDRSLTQLHRLCRKIEILRPNSHLIQSISKLRLTLPTEQLQQRRVLVALTAPLLAKVLVRTLGQIDAAISELTTDQFPIAERDKKGVLAAIAITNDLRRVKENLLQSAVDLGMSADRNQLSWNSELLEASTLACNDHRHPRPYFQLLLWVANSISSQNWEDFALSWSRPASDTSSQEAALTRYVDRVATLDSVERGVRRLVDYSSRLARTAQRVSQLSCELRGAYSARHFTAVASYWTIRLPRHQLPGFQSAVIYTADPTALVGRLRDLFERTRKGYPQAVADIEFPAGAGLYVIPRISFTNDGDGVGAFAKSLGPLAFLFGKNIDLSNKLVVLPPGVPFQGTSREARVAIVGALVQVIEERGGKVWLVATGEPGHASLTLNVRGLAATTAALLATVLQQARYPAEVIKDITAPLAHSRRKSATRLATYEEIANITQNLQDPRFNGKFVESLCSAFFGEVIEKYSGSAPAIESVHLLRVIGGRAANADRHDSHCISQNADLYRQRGLTVPGLNDGRSIVAQFTPRDSRGKNLDPVNFRSKGGVSPVLLIGGNSTGKTTTLMHLAYGHAAANIQRGFLAGGSSFPRGAMAVVIGGKTESYLSNLRGALQNLTEAEGGTLYLDELPLPHDEIPAMQCWILRECSQRNIKLVMNSNNPWEMIEQVQRCGGDVFRVRHHNGVRTIVPHEDAPYTPADAIDEAIAAAARTLPLDVIRRAHEIARDFSSHPGP